MLGQGVWRLLSNFYFDQAVQEVSPKNYTISFAQRLDGTGKLGRPVKIACVGEDSRIQWSMSPEKLVANEGAFFVLEDRSIDEATTSERPKGRFNSNHMSNE